MDELKRRSVSISAKHVLFLVDACYSGLATEFHRGLDLDTQGFLQKVAKLPVRHIITAGTKNEQVVEKPEWGHGAFTYKLLEALRTGASDWNDDAVTTGGELAEYLREVVPTIADQTPHQGRFAGQGEFLFVHADAMPTDTESPRIDLIEPSEVRGKRGDLRIKPTDKIAGLVTDNVGVENVLVDGQPVSLTAATEGERKRGFEVEGTPISPSPDTKTVRFEVEIFVSDVKPDGVEIQAMDGAGNRDILLVHLTPPGQGTLLVNTKPMGAKIYIDGKFVAYAPKAIKNLPAGHRKVRLVLGERVYETAVTIRANATEKLSHSW